MVIKDTLQINEFRVIENIISISYSEADPAQQDHKNKYDKYGFHQLENHTSKGKEREYEQQHNWKEQNIQNIVGCQRLHATPKLT
jgi:hypothetical protein